MSYSTTLSQMIEKSGLTLKALADQCNQMGVKIDQSYISKLKTGKLPPASDDVNEALVKVCEGDLEEFLYEAYLEKAPLFMKENIKQLIAAHKELHFSNLKSSFNEITDEDLQKIESDINNMTDIEIFRLTKKINEDLPNLKAEMYSFKKKLKGETEEYQTYPIHGVIMDDDSMEPRIPKGSSLGLVGLEYLKSGDIVLAKINNNTFVVRRYLFVDEKIILLSEKLTYDPIIAIDESIELVGKVKHVRITL
ncbi:LexA family transcriptional regulator [Brevibacillus choshinensis]|uniref:LexA family transcriptional regulator n=1 Tax=Brevibacillus choshinensis TaxID=54911 RepID=UPI002E1E8F0D|nr:LexA family transcriptional regulator [Brevibacillus choshinensis]